MKRFPARQRRPRTNRPVLTRERALARLREVKQVFAGYINRTFGHKALDCATCQTPCCADAQFVNVNITRLEAEAMLDTIERSPAGGREKLDEVLDRAADCVRRFGLGEEGDTFATTYACPLFEPGKGCLVHWKAKPAPCIQHGCYEDWRDLPETRSLARVERTVEKLNEAVYDEPSEMLTIPVWLLKAANDRR